MTQIFALDEQEIAWLAGTIKKYRKKFIKSPMEYLDLYGKENPLSIDKVKRNVSATIEQLREGCWQLYLKDESVFHKEIISHLIKERKCPNTILKEIVEEKILDRNNYKIPPQNLVDELSDVIGTFTGNVMPYFYALDLSTTNSRRSRSGKTFEAIIKYLITKVYKYPFDDQSNIGEGFYRTNDIGKIVDGIIPDKTCYTNNRSKCLIITMKTSLRERWQEVAEEIKRTNVPQIYLLTVDDDISESKIKTMGHQNITIVNYDSMKSKYPRYNNLISFTEFFNEEIPHCLSYWSNKK